MKTLIISPTYNEHKNISDLISKIKNVNNKYHILIIDDNSPDGTGKIVEDIMTKYDNVFLIKRKGKLGLGTAYCEGFNWAINNKYDTIIQMDADLSHNPKDIPKLIAELKNADLIIGSRYIDGVNVINWPISRLLLSYFANVYARLIIGLNIKDLTGGFKCYNRMALQNIDISSIKSEGYSFQIELNFLVWINGFKLKEIPIVFTDRTIGESKMNKSIIIEAIFIVPKLFFKKVLNKMKFKS